MRYTYLTGRCWNGAQRDAGKIIHAVDDTKRPDAYYYDDAICGARAGYRSNGWSDYNAPAPTCTKCIAKLAKMTA